MIEVSRSELSAALVKAMLGAGADRVLADGVAAAALWLHGSGHNGTREVVRISTTSVSAEALGVSTIDLLVAGAATSRAVSPDSRLLLTGLLEVAQLDHQRRFVLTGDAPPYTLTAEPATGPRPDAATPLRIHLSEADWLALNEAAARICVPSNERSRATGAGAGLVDAD